MPLCSSLISEVRVLAAAMRHTILPSTLPGAEGSSGGNIQLWGHALVVDLSCGAKDWRQIA